MRDSDLATGMALLDQCLPRAVKVAIKSFVHGCAWPQEQVPAAMCQALLRHLGPPPGVLAARLGSLATATLDEPLTAFLVKILGDSTWAQWRYTVPRYGTPFPNYKPGKQDRGAPR